MESLLAAAGDLDNLLDELEEENHPSDKYASHKKSTKSQVDSTLGNDTVQLGLTKTLSDYKTIDPTDTVNPMHNTMPDVNDSFQKNFKVEKNITSLSPISNNSTMDKPQSPIENLLEFDDLIVQAPSSAANTNQPTAISNIDLLLQLTDFNNFSIENNVAKEQKSLHNLSSSNPNNSLEANAPTATIDKYSKTDELPVINDSKKKRLNRFHIDKADVIDTSRPTASLDTGTAQTEKNNHTTLTTQEALQLQNLSVRQNDIAVPTDFPGVIKEIQSADASLNDNVMCVTAVNPEPVIGFSNDVNLSETEINEFLQSQAVMDQIMSQRNETDSSSTCSSDTSASVTSDNENNVSEITNNKLENMSPLPSRPEPFSNNERETGILTPSTNSTPQSQTDIDDIQVLPFEQGAYESVTPKVASLPVQRAQPQALALGDYKPTWVPDSEAPNCNLCQNKFTFTRRRHHCRACGKVFCNNCCYHKTTLNYLESRHEERVCSMCYSIIIQKPQTQLISTRDQRITSTSEESTSSQQQSVSPSSQSGCSVRPKNTPQVPMPKSVRFADGTKPDHPIETPLTPPMPTRGPRLRKSKFNGGSENTFPPVVLERRRDKPYQVEENPDINFISSILASEGPDPVEFLINPNLVLKIRFLMCGSRHCWCFWSSGMSSVGQNEIAILFEREGLGDVKIPKDVFLIFRSLYDRARRGKVINNYDLISSNVLGFSKDQIWCGSKLNAGMIFVEPSYQFFCGFYPGDANRDSSIEHKKYFSVLFGLLVHRSECPWAALVPKRLLLRLGAETQQYPCPLFSVRQRQSVFADIGHTILGILCDFTNYKYKVLTVPGIKVIVNTAGKILLQIPCNRFSDIIKIINSSSNESVFAVASGALSPPREKSSDVDEDTLECDSHLVCIQDTKSLSYHTELLAMKTVTPFNTGAVFIVFNGSLHSEEHNSIRANIIEDGVMVQLMPEKMSQLITSLKAMDDFQVINPLTGPHATVKSLEIQWINDDKNFNLGLFSPIDYTSFEGILGFNVQGRSEQKSQNYIMRWNQVFFIDNSSDTLDSSRLAEQIANSVFLALTPLLQDLVNNNQMNLSIRVTIHPDNVSYLAGSLGSSLPPRCMNSLDNELVSTIHSAASNLPADSEPIILELLFSVLNIRFNYVTASDLE